MLEGTQSGCINHPGVESTVRCKQCGKPVCDTCVQSGPTGRFCSTDCRAKHEAFYQQAQGLENKTRGSFFVKLRHLIGTLIIIAVALAAIGFVASLIEIPVLTPLVFRVREAIGI